MVLKWPFLLSVLNGSDNVNTKFRDYLSLNLICAFNNQILNIKNDGFGSFELDYMLANETEYLTLGNRFSNSFFIMILNDLKSYLINILKIIV